MGFLCHGYSISSVEFPYSKFFKEGKHPTELNAVVNLGNGDMCLKSAIILFFRISSGGKTEIILDFLTYLN